MLTPPADGIWNAGDPYERYIGRWSRKIAPLFLSWLDIPPGRRWLDVGCGTGALTAAILEQCDPASVVGVEPSDGFRETAASNLAGRAELVPGSATEIPLGGQSVDVTVSGLVLNFVSEPLEAVDEMVRVTAPVGTVAAYVWDYAGKMELIRYFWDAAVELDPSATALDEGKRFPLCQPDELTQFFLEAGLGGVEVKELEVPTVFSDFDDYWQPFLGGQGPAPAYAMSLSEHARTELRAILHDRLPIDAGGSFPLVARAWAVRGNVS